MRRSFVVLVLGVLLSMSALVAGPAMAIEPTPQLLAAFFAPEKAMTSADACLSAITAVQAQTATASASAERLCSGYAHAVASAHISHEHNAKLAHINRSHASLIALGVDPGDGSEEGEGDGKLAA